MDNIMSHACHFLTCNKRKMSSTKIIPRKDDCNLHQINF